MSMLGRKVISRHRVCLSCRNITELTGPYCPNCGTPFRQLLKTGIAQSPINKQRIYEEEKLRFEARETIKRKKRTEKLFMRLAVIVLMIVFGYGIMSDARVRKWWHEGEIPKGSVVALHSSGPKHGVPTDLDAFKEYWHALGSGNNQTIARLIIEGRVILVDSGTKVRTLDDGPLLYEVKIIEGEHTGETGYIQKSEITYANSE